MAILNVDLGERSYAITISPGLLDDPALALKDYASKGRLLIITDSNVGALYAQRFSETLGRQQITAHILTLSAGEETKSWVQLEAVTDWLIGHGVERSESIVALGGGVIGDLVGLASALVKRGCQFVQIPTSLLAQVDSSVGGKTAINSRAGKNLIGVFHQPKAVLIDPKMLATLPPREMRAGYAEIVKYGLINDRAFFEWCYENGAALLAGDHDLAEKAIYDSLRSKADIVAADERETRNVRALLNLGHTFGHALEAETGFSDRLLHGEAVALGMVLAHDFSVEQGFCPNANAERLRTHFVATGLPTTLAEVGIAASGETLVAHMAHDKKMTGGKLPFILTHGIGEAFITRDIAMQSVADFLEDQRSKAPAIHA
ncbi:3-dehydroquinate synthase [Alterisphingorhabdus coralli]|uniref:3-dehydroquinate synthase n=1 Tax=Alterisphingorhabdus coralli TaxID=3071408 RepID=A0AA97F4G8_9SPHN|nr:3-dehydroquinate synthase [Parasphingorhabdus sp. SCSIO 66989]WOE74139.1 3-dehydroquinate synthase [Parasphingorhabdus sp. SCSIO 66989]